MEYSVAIIEKSYFNKPKKYMIPCIPNIEENQRPEKLFQLSKLQSGNCKKLEFNPWEELNFLFDPQVKNQNHRKSLFLVVFLLPTI